MPVTRREVLMGAAGAGLTLGAARWAGADPPMGGKSTDYLLPVPEALPEKVFTTDRVGISRRTHEEHFKLYQGYARKTNELRTKLKDYAVTTVGGNQIYSEMRALKVNYAFAYGGFLNHLVYFDTLGGRGGEADGRVGELIAERYGSFENWLADWKATGMAARGWVFLAYDHLSQSVFSYIGDAQDTFPMWDNTLLLAMDVYEHAFYLDFQTARARYIDAYCQVIDWDAVNARLPR